MNLEKNKKFKSGKSQGKFKLNEKHHVWVQTAPLYLYLICISNKQIVEYWAKL